MRTEDRRPSYTGAKPNITCKPILIMTDTGPRDSFSLLYANRLPAIKRKRYTDRVLFTVAT